MGKLNIVGIGPGNYENMTIRADKALKNSDIIIGYTVYVELIRPIYPDKEYMSTAMTQEAERCRTALELAADEKNVSLVCSGDSGIYGMAALALELRGDKTEPQIEVIPGLTAACSGAALLGAPLTHDFAVISLSDRLTAWDKIEKRLECAAKADLSIVIYNPCSKGRPEHLKKACDILLKYLPEDRVCGVAENIGRTGESRKILSLKELREARLNMFCTVFVGNTMSLELGGNMLTPRGYRNV